MGACWCTLFSRPEIKRLTYSRQVYLHVQVYNLPVEVESVLCFNNTLRQVRSIVSLSNPRLTAGSSNLNLIYYLQARHSPTAQTFLCSLSPRLRPPQYSNRIVIFWHQPCTQHAKKGSRDNCWVKDCSFQIYEVYCITEKCQLALVLMTRLKEYVPLLCYFL